ncbi:ligand-binding sensor domain-containing protein [Formosa sp. S-31]|uniref:ligand-binding sensor domain-containing protein n=1 Tax=Formosa sp. S-31 TaxID=2790949 RepID=UPI003EBA8C29
MKTIQVVLVILFWVINAQSQTTEVLQVNYLGQEKGLLQLNTKVLALDDMGYLWVGTEDGLHRFNGYDFKNYIANPKDQKAIPDDHIRGLLSVNDTLWIGTNSKGIIGYKRSKNEFFSILPDEASRDLNLGYKLFVVNKSYLLFSVRNHFILFNRLKKTYEILKLQGGDSEDKVEDVLKIDDENYWLATSSSGVIQFNLKSKKLQELTTVKSSAVNCFLDSNDHIYIGTGEGVYIYNKLSNKVTKTSVAVSVDGFYKLNEFEFLLYTHSGVLKYNSVTDLSEQLVLKNDRDNKIYTVLPVSQIIGDNKGNIWFGTEGEGLFHFNKYQNKFKSHSLNLPEIYNDQRISIFPMYKSNDTILWLGTYAGTVKYNLANDTYKLYDTGKGGITYEFCKDLNGTLWAGSITEGLMKYNDSLDVFKQWKHKDSINSLPDNEVLEILPISENKLWVCTWAGGIAEFDTQTEKFSPVLLNGKQINRARVSLIDSKHNIWLGTDEGLYRISPSNTIKVFLAEAEVGNNLTNNRVFSLQEDKTGNIWVGTSSGLTCINSATQKTEQYYKQKGFPNDFVYGILFDTSNRVWMNTNYGLSVFDQELKTFKNYTKEDGLQDNEFNAKSSYKDEQGNLYFGGINGFNIINPEKIVDNPHLPEVYLETVELFNKPVERNEMFQDTLTFNSNENVLTFNFSAINYLNPQKCLYTYKLENFDDEWSPVSKKNNVTYTNLNPGTYNLKIKASNDVGEWSPNIRKVTLIIVPPWYQTTWFKVLIAGLVLFSSFVFYKYKTSKLKHDKIKLENIVAARTRDLSEKNRALNESNTIAKAQKENIEFLMKELHHRVKNNLQIISSLLNMQANNVDDKQVKDILNIAKNRILTIAYIQNDLTAVEGKLDVSKFLKEFSLKVLSFLSDQETAKFQIKFNLEPCICELNTTLLGLIVNELITNTYKYAFEDSSKGNVLEIGCKRENNDTIIEISDNGKGYALHAVGEKSLGLDLVNAMVSQMHAQLETSVNNGVTNVITITC